MHIHLTHKSTRLFIYLSAFFICNAIIAECIGVKIFSLEKLFGHDSTNLRLFGIEGLSFNLTAGVLLWPLVFIFTDIINEYYGPRGVRMISYIAAALIAYTFIMFVAAMQLPPADFWIQTNSNKGVPDMQQAFSAIFGQGSWIIIGSLSAFIIGQIADVFVFYKIKKMTGERLIWLRATGSTLVSQLIDSFVVLFIAFYVGQGWSLKLVSAICVLNYIYKFMMAILMTPLIYLVHNRIEKYLGADLAGEMRQAAMTDS
ncbi:MAG: queuosine precursor transporter [Bacteroidota bacterium]